MNPHILLLLTAFLWSSGGLFIKLVSWPGPAVAGLRSMVAAICLWQFRRDFGGTKKEWFCAVSYALCLITFVMATKLGPAANAIILQYSGPIHAAYLGWFILGERVRKADYFLLPIALCGTALCFFDSLNSGSLLGNTFGLISGFFFGLMAVLLRALPNNSRGSIFVGNLLAALLAIPFLGSLDISFTNIGGVIFLGTFQIALPYVLFSMALKQVSAVEATMFSLLEAILNPIWVALVLGEIPSRYTAIGGAIVIVILATRALITGPNETVKSIKRGLA